MIDFDYLKMPIPYIGMRFSETGEDEFLTGNVIGMIDSDGDETNDGEFAVALIIKLQTRGFLAVDLSKLSPDDFIRQNDIN